MLSLPKIGNFSLVLTFGLDSFMYSNEITQKLSHRIVFIKWVLKLQRNILITYKILHK